MVGVALWWPVLAPQLALKLTADLRLPTPI